MSSTGPYRIPCDMAKEIKAVQKEMCIKWIDACKIWNKRKEGIWKKI